MRCANCLRVYFFPVQELELRVTTVPFRMYLVMPSEGILPTMSDGILGLIFIVYILFWVIDYNRSMPHAVSAKPLTSS